MTILLRQTFESNIGDWTEHLGADMPARSDTRAWQGAWSMRVARGAGTNIHWADLPLTGLEPDTDYTLSAYLWVPSGNTDMAGLFVSGDVTTAVFQEASANDQWVRVERSFTTSSAAVPNVTGWVRGGVDGEVWVDAVLVNDGVTAEPFPVTTYPFEPPTVPQSMPNAGMWSYFTTDLGVTLFRENGAWVEHPYPTDGELLNRLDGIDYMLGGRIYDVDDATAAELVASGYTVPGYGE